MGIYRNTRVEIVGLIQGAGEMPFSSQATLKVETIDNHPSGAKAHRFLSAVYGTAEAMPFHSATLTMDC